MRIGPVAGGCFFGFHEALFEQNGYGPFDTHVFSVAALVEHGVEFQDALWLNAEFVNDAFAVIAQPKSGFDDAFEGQQIGSHRSTLGLVQLKYPSPLGRGQLQDVRPVRLFTHLESRFGFGVKAPRCFGDELLLSKAGLGACSDQSDAVQSEPLERWEEGDGFFVGRAAVLGLVLHVGAGVHSRASFLAFFEPSLR